MSFINLPYELIVNIFKYLSLPDLIKMEKINKKIKKIIVTNHWSHIVKMGKNMNL